MPNVRVKVSMVRVRVSMVRVGLIGLGLDGLLRVRKLSRVKVMVSIELWLVLGLVLVGCFAQWLERWSLTGKLSCPTLDLQLTGNHLCG